MGERRVVWKLCKALNGFRRASLRFQNFLLAILAEKLGFKKDASIPTVVSHIRDKCETTCLWTTLHALQTTIEWTICSQASGTVAQHTNHRAHRTNIARNTNVENLHRVSENCQRIGSPEEFAMECGADRGRRVALPGAVVNRILLDKTKTQHVSTESVHVQVHTSPEDQTHSLAPNVAQGNWRTQRLQTRRIWRV